MKIEHSVFVRNENADISKFTALPAERLAMLRIESAAAEQTIFQKLQGATAEWEAQAAQTALLDKAIEYVKTPTVEHTSNKVLFATSIAVHPALQNNEHFQGF